MALSKRKRLTAVERLDDELCSRIFRASMEDHITTIEVVGVLEHIKQRLVLHDVGVLDCGESHEEEN